ncbi:hypothetical protein D9757_007714 [Collybiopsis confluens]|uniref:Transmembrane protein n=1 Tax=Collybiopsis confluens TaxID=2823264 RepID=A0A8H5M1C6_9AGAR|nr:hypothetical protein D9757_007714 [Collybiopsis confluens]
MTSIEMDDLSNRDPTGDVVQAKLDSEAEFDGTISSWTLVTAILLTVFAAILSLFPQFLLFLASTGRPSSTLTSLERFLATHFAIWLFTIAIAMILNIPSSSPLPAKLPHPNHPLLMPFTFACLFSALISYNTRSVGSLTSVHCFITAIVGLYGLYVVLFGSSSRISTKTGADKHTSAFIFGNKSAASKQKKEWSNRQREKRNL